MTEFESNSYKSKETDQENSREKNLEKVVSGDVKKKEKTGFQKFIDLFVADDIHNMAGYIISEIIIPATKEAFLNTVCMILYGNKVDDAPSSHTYGRQYDYTQHSSKKSNITLSGEPYKRYTRFDNVVIPSRREAEDVRDKMLEICQEYHNVSVADFYEIVGIEDDNYTNNDIGWFDDDVKNSVIVRSREGYEISIAKPKPL